MVHFIHINAPYFFHVMHKYQSHQTWLYVVIVRSESLGSENRPWLKYIQEENKMHCVTCDEAAEVDKSINNNLNNP